MTNGMLWNIHKIARYGDTYMILDHNVLKFTGNLLIEKVNVSVHHMCALDFLFYFSIINSNKIAQVKVNFVFFEMHPKNNAALVIIN